MLQETLEKMCDSHNEPEHEETLQQLPTSVCDEENPFIPADIELPPNSKDGIEQVIFEESDILRETLAQPLCRIIGTRASRFGKDFSLDVLYPLDEHLSEFASLHGISRHQALGVKNTLDGSVHTSSLLITDKIVGLGLELNQEGHNGNNRDLVQAVLSWSTEHLEHRYPTAYSREVKSRRGREITLNQALSSLIVSGYHLSTILSNSSEYTDVTEIERLKVGIYLALRARYEYSNQGLIQILLSLSSSGIFEESDIERLLPNLERYGPQIFWDQDRGIKEQSKMYEAFRNISLETAQSLSGKVGRFGRMSYLEIICSNRGWPFDPLMLKFDTGQESSMDSSMQAFWNLFDSLPSEPQRLSIREISRRSGLLRVELKRNLDQAANAIQQDDPGMIFPVISYALNIPGRQSPRDSQEVEEHLKEGIISTITSLQERQDEDMEPSVRFELAQRTALITAMQEIAFAPRDRDETFRQYSLDRKLSKLEFDRIRSKLESSLTLKLHTAASRQYPTTLLGIAPSTVRAIVLETMHAPHSQIFKGGRVWSSRLLALEALSNHSLWTEKFKDLARVAADGVSPRVVEVINEHQAGIPPEFQIPIDSYISSFRQFCALASLSAGVPNGSFHDSLLELSQEKIPMNPINSSSPATLMDRLHNNHIAFLRLQENVAPGKMEQIVSELCYLLSEHQFIPLLDTLAVATAQGYSIQYISETIYPEQLLEASQRATEQYRRHPENGFNFAPYKTLFHYLRAGKRCLLAASISALPEYSPETQTTQECEHPREGDD
jgi:hypothetical protein